MEQEAVLDLYRASGALLEGHFKLSSGLHSNRYLQSALVLQFPEFATTLGEALAARNAHLQPTAVLSPALGGIVIGQEVGRGLGVRALFAERVDGALTLRRGFTLSDSDRVLIVEDVITTGGSTVETARAAEPLAPMSWARRRSSIAARTPRSWGCRCSRWSGSRCNPGRPISARSARRATRSPSPGRARDPEPVMWRHAPSS